MDDKTLQALTQSQVVSGNQQSAPEAQPPVTQPAPTNPPQSPISNTPELDAFVANDMKYGTPVQEAITGLEGAGEALTFGASTALETKLGLAKPEDILGRRDTNPEEHMTGTLLGLGAANLIPAYGEAADAREALMAARLAHAEALGTAGAEQAAQGLEIAQQVAKNAVNPLSSQSIMSGAGRGLAGALGFSAQDASALSQIGAHTIQGATEMALLQGGDELSKMIINDPNQSAQTAIANIGIAAGIGAIGGGVIGAVSPLAKATSEMGVGQGISDFKNRIMDYLNNPDEVGNFNRDMGSFIEHMNRNSEGIYGDTGIKGAVIRAHLPELNESMLNQAADLYGKADSALNTSLKGDPLSYKLSNKLEQFKSELSGAESSEQVFDAIQDMKKQLQEWGQYNKALVPLAERDFRDTAKGLGFNFRQALEDTDVWGKAGEFQHSINRSVADYLPSLKDMKKRFLTTVQGEDVFNPAAGENYIKQLGSAKADIKQEVMSNFVNDSLKLKRAVNDSYSSIGLTNPYAESVPMNNILATLKQKTPGEKLADEFIRKNLSGIAGKSLGAAIGGGVGHMTGIPGATWAGGWFGEKVLGKFLGSVMPSIAKPILTKGINAEGFMAASDYGMNIVRGDNMINKATRALFKAGPRVFGTIPANEKLDKLDEKLKELQVNSELLNKAGGSIGHYLPEHNVAIGQTVGNIVSYLNGLRPNTERQNPLDSELPPNPVEEAKYRNALRIAENPLSVLQKLDEGKLTAEDVGHLNNMYPNLAASLRTKIVDQMTNALAEKKPIPYKVKLGLSMFIGQPLDSTMTPNSLQSIQMTFMGGTPSQQQAMAKSKGSMKNINKLGTYDMTPGQARDAKKSSLNA